MTNKVSLYIAYFMLIVGSVTMCIALCLTEYEQQRIWSAARWARGFAMTVLWCEGPFALMCFIVSRSKGSIAMTVIVGLVVALTVAFFVLVFQYSNYNRMFDPNDRRTTAHIFIGLSSFMHWGATGLLVFVFFVRKMVRKEA